MLVGRWSVIFETGTRKKHLTDAVQRIVEGVVAGTKDAKGGGGGGGGGGCGDGGRGGGAAVVVGAEAAEAVAAAAVAPIVEGVLAGLNTNVTRRDVSDSTSTPVREPAMSQSPARLGGSGWQYRNPC